MKFRLLIVFLILSSTLLIAPQHDLMAEDSAPFDVGQSKLSDTSLDSYASYLVNFAQAQVARDKKFNSSKQYNNFIQMALLLAPKNKAAVLANGRLRKNKEPRKTKENIKVADFSKKILAYYKKFAKTKNKDAVKIGGHLLSLAMMVDENNEDLEYDLEIYSSAYSEPVWKAGKAVGNVVIVQATDKSRQSRIHGLVVMTINGVYVGKTSKILATYFPRKKRNSFINVDFVRTLGKGGSMQTSLHEAVRYWRTLNTVSLSSGQIEVSFEDKYSLKDGGSAGTAYVILLRALDEDFKIDPKFAVTGDISVEGKILKIGGVYAKIRGAFTDGCLFVGIPQDNESELVDGIILNGVEALTKIEIYSFDTIKEILKLAKLKKEISYTKRTALFKKVQALTAKKGWEKTPAAMKLHLDEILASNPNHLSAKLLKLYINDKLPKNLSLSSSIAEIDKHLVQYLKLISHSGGDVSVSSILNETKTINVGRYSAALTKIKDLIHPDAAKFHAKARSLSSYIRTFISSNASIERYQKKVKTYGTALEKKKRDWESGKKTKSRLRSYNSAVKRYNDTIASLNKTIDKKEKYWKKVNTGVKEYIQEIRRVVTDPKVLEKLVRGK